MIQYAGYTPLNWVTARNEAVLYHQKEDLENRVEKTAFGHGAAMMLPRHVIDQLGEMPEVYFLYYEELEWGHRLKQLGYQIAVDHSTYILHKESVSVGKGSPLKTYFITRNRMLFMRRNAGTKWWLFMLYFALVVLPAHVLRYTIKRDWAQLKSLVAGVQWNCTNTTTSDRLGYIYGNLKFS